jgi:glycosyltransferase involved in cell wall biosynthesis
MPVLLLDFSHTSHTRARTGIQKVTRSLWQHLGEESEPVTFDPYLEAWRALEHWEHAVLKRHEAGAKRGAHWPAIARWRGHWRRFTRQTPAHALRGDFAGFIEPELFSPAVARRLPDVFARMRGPRVAVFHDAIALRFPELSPAATVARFPGYLRELLMFDGIAAVSEDSRDSLVDYWRWLGAANPPPVVAIPLGVDVPARPPAPSSHRTASPVILCVGTIEGRKNHAALLEACESLWRQGRQFDLQVIGGANAATGGAALRRLRALQTAGRPLRYDGPVAEEALETAYTACTFTVYASVAEGFGLPVIESLARGKPCVCSAHGAIGESARGGGCLALDAVDAASLATALVRLLDAPAELAALAAAARARTFKPWAAYASELLAWMHLLPRR